MDEQSIFRTGLGISVEVKKSSIARARSVLGDVDCVLTDAGTHSLVEICGNVILELYDVIIE